MKNRIGTFDNKMELLYCDLFFYQGEGINLAPDEKKLERYLSNFNYMTIPNAEDPRLLTLIFWTPKGTKQTKIIDAILNMVQTEGDVFFNTPIYSRSGLKIRNVSQDKRAAGNKRPRSYSYTIFTYHTIGEDKKYTYSVYIEKTGKTRKALETIGEGNKTIYLDTISHSDSHYWNSNVQISLGGMTIKEVFGRKEWLFLTNARGIFKEEDFEEFQDIYKSFEIFFFDFLCYPIFPKPSPENSTRRPKKKPERRLNDWGIAEVKAYPEELFFIDEDGDVSFKSGQKVKNILGSVFIVSKNDKLRKEMIKAIVARNPGRALELWVEDKMKSLTIEEKVMRFEEMTRSSKERMKNIERRIKEIVQIKEDILAMEHKIRISEATLKESIPFPKIIPPKKETKYRGQSLEGMITIENGKTILRWRED